MPSHPPFGVVRGGLAGEAWSWPERCTSDTGQIVTCRVVRLQRRILDIVDTSPSEMMLASLEPETLLAWCCAFFGMAQREALGWSCTGLSVTVAGRSAPVHRHARGTGSQAYFVLEVLVVSVFGGGGGGRGGAGYVWPRAVDVFL